MKRLFWPLIAVCAVFGLTARVWNIDFDMRQHLHPDERFWALTAADLQRQPRPAAHGTVVGPMLDWLDGQRSPASPYRVTKSFLYGPLPLTLARSTSAWLHDGAMQGSQPANAVVHSLNAIGIPLLDSDGAPRFDAGYGVDLIGRLLGAVFDTLTIVVVALIGRRLGGRGVGGAAGGLYSVSVLAIQHAHFLGSEPLLGLASALTVLCMLRLDRSNDAGKAATSGMLVGLAGGLAAAVKFTGVSMIAVAAVCCGGLLLRHRRRSDIVRLGAVLLGAFAAFRVFNPSAFNGLGLGVSKAFTDDLHLARALKNSTAPPSFQWADRTPILQPLIWLGKFTVGPGVVIAAGAGTAVMAAPLVRRWMQRTPSPRVNDALWPHTVVAAFAIVPFLYISIGSLPTGRYYLPMLPALYAVSGLGVATMVRLAKKSHGAVRGAASLAAALSVGLSVVWGVGFVNGVHGSPNTRIDASEWIAGNVPPGSVLSMEAWDDGLPLRLPNVDADQFRSERLDLVGPDDETKVAKMAEQLGRIDYVIESSPRIWGTVTRMPVRFPSTIKFFDGLNSGALGFERVATFRRGISLGPWRLADASADESFSVYDHPEVRIWHKVRTVDHNAIISLLDPIAASNALPVEAPSASARGLVLTDDELTTNATGPTYNQAFDTGGSNLLHVVAWFVLLEVLGFAAFAIFTPMLEPLPDAGLGLAKVIALASLASAMFIASGWLHIDLDRTVATLITTAFLAAGALFGYRRRALLRRLWSERRPILIAVEALTLAAFVALILIRAMNPDLWHPQRGGEKPFELALLTAVLRTKTIPVYDPWYSRGALNYYYGGWLLLSAPARVLRTSPTLLMNIALGVFASCSAGAAYSLGAALVHPTRTRWRRHSRSERTSVIAGILAAVFVLAASNGTVVKPILAWVNGSRNRGHLDWWSMSRVIPKSVAVTEFPAWSQLFGDVHPHIMGIGMLLAVGTLCIAWFRSLADARHVHALLLALLLGLAAGLVRMTNTWDFPLCVGLVVLTLIVAVAVRIPWRGLVLPTVTWLIVLVSVWLPYTRRGEVFDSGFEAATLRTPPSSWLMQFGLFAAIAVAITLAHLATAIRASRRVLGWLTRAHLAVVGLSAVALGYLAFRPGFEVFEITTSLSLASVWVAWQRLRRPPFTAHTRLSPLGPSVLAVGWAIQAGVELLTVRNDSGRMNTVFKFWFESWIVLAVGCAVVVTEQLRSRERWLRRTYKCLAAGVVVTSVGFWLMATPVRIDDRLSNGGLSLDGAAYLDDRFVFGDGRDRFVPADDLPLVDWIRGNVHGIHVVAEAPGRDYQWTSRISWLTGLPTPIGWSYHESQQRRPYGASIETRKKDMTDLYTTTDVRVMAQVLSRYSAAYVVFGTQEHLLASDASRAALRSFECLTVVASADRSVENGVVTDDLFVASVDLPCVIRSRPPLPTRPPPA